MIRRGRGENGDVCTRKRSDRHSDRTGTERRGEGDRRPVVAEACAHARAGLVQRRWAGGVTGSRGSRTRQRRQDGRGTPPYGDTTVLPTARCENTGSAVVRAPPSRRRHFFSLFIFFCFLVLWCRSGSVTTIRVGFSSLCSLARSVYRQTTRDNPIFCSIAFTAYTTSSLWYRGRGFAIAPPVFSTEN